MNRWWLGGAALLVCACASSPQPRYYLLEAQRAAQPHRVSEASATRLSVLVEPVAVPAQVDRPQFVRDTKANEVAIEDLHRWAAPLQDNFAEVLAQDLSAQLGSPDVSTSQDAGGAHRFHVQVAIREFRSRLGEYAELGASWSVRRTDGTTRAGYSSFREPAAGEGDFAALAAAHSRAILRLSAEISAAIRALEKG